MVHDHKAVLHDLNQERLTTALLDVWCNLDPKSVTHVSPETFDLCQALCWKAHGTQHIPERWAAEYAAIYGPVDHHGA